MKHKKHSGKSKKHKSRKEKKSKDKKKEKRVRQESDSSSSCSSTDNEENVWVEKKMSPQAEEGLSEARREEAPKREEWMSLNTLFPCVSNMSKEEKNKSNSSKESSILTQPGQSSRELNPYWKNGGSGLPQDDPGKSSSEPVMDANWLKKSLERAKEQAAGEGRSLEEIAAERWGSLETIRSMIANAERASGKDGQSWRNGEKSFRYRRRSRSREGDGGRQRSNRYSDSARDRRRSRSRSRSRTRDYRKVDDFADNRQRRQAYKRPTDDEAYSSPGSTSRLQISGSKRWQKESAREKMAEDRRISEPKNCDANSEVREIVENETDTQSEPNTEESKVLTKAEMNKLGARIVKAEIMGDTELASELKRQLEQARELMKSKADEPETVILTRTDSKGVSRPLEQRPRSGEPSTSRKKKSVPTHAAGERVRHFYDDDKYSLQQLFQREKGRSTNEDDAAFTRVVSKSMDMSEIFEDEISRAPSDAKQEERHRALAINEHKRLTKSLDNCQWCVDSGRMLKHTIVAMDSRICLSLPAHASLTEGHCVLTPVHHIACQLQMDEDVYESLKTFRKALCGMFAEQDKYPVFFEVYKNRHKFPHMRLECVPLPIDVGELAPMYFKKALLECETEWSVNKKIIDLKGKDLRQAVPNGLAYFVVQFANGSGYAHVIEDDQMFPRNFAEEIIGGMLDLDHDLWRKPRRENFDQQREKVLSFSKAWTKHDPGTDVAC